MNIYNEWIYKTECSNASRIRYWFNFVKRMFWKSHFLTGFFAFLGGESLGVPVNGSRAFWQDLKGCCGCEVSQKEKSQQFEQKNVIYLVVSRIFYKVYSIDNVKTLFRPKKTLI